MKTIMLALLGVVAATAVSAQSMPDCKGNFEVIRNDTIKPGKFDEFKKAVADHEAWYRKHGLGDKILLGQVISTEGGARAYSTDTAVTIHANETEASEKVAQDDAFKAFVAEYKDSSILTSTTRVCLTEPGK